MQINSQSPVTADSPSVCRLCGGPHLECMGAIPGTDFFAGRVLTRVLPGGRLWRCLDCESLFRHPVLSPAAYRQLYESGAAGQWSGDGQRLDLQTVKSAVLEHGGARVLDIGCGNGDFLASLPPALTRFGIEPSIGAASEAERHGIHIVASTMEVLRADARFDVITIIDVIEHVAEPQGLLAQAQAHLSDGGIIIVSTGNPLHAVWRKVFGSRFWYSSFPEHISFPSRAFFAAWAQDRQATVVAERATRYRTLPHWKRAVYLFIQLVYLASPRSLDYAGQCIGALMRAPKPRRRHFSPGVAGLFVDHQVIVIRKGPPSTQTSTRPNSARCVETSTRRASMLTGQ